MSIDNPNAFVNKVLKDTLGNQTYVSFSNLSPGPHAVFIRDANGCLDTLLLEVPGKFFIPNLVSPNGDFKNDVFEVVSLPDNSEVRIFNRWGDRVFESKNYDNKYDFAGLSDGVYYYDLEFDTGTRFKGWVQVIR
jgi:gliding motility-associated-like protein